VATTDSTNAPAGDRRVRRTRGSLQRALIELVAEQDLSLISVADVVDRADVSRSTFYDHYRDVHELAEAACTSMIDDMLAPLTAVDPNATRPSGDDPNPAVTAFFTHFAEHAGLYRSLLGPAGSARVIEHVRQRTMATARLSPMLPSPMLRAAGDTPKRAGTDPPQDSRDVPAAFVASALLGVASDWLQRGCPQTPRELTILTEPLLSALRNTPASPAPRASRRQRRAPS
jgi:AcrR family transcriptional regulator